ncbi:phage tail component [Clostridium novyi A str. 4540]|uniref:distal tail protein Dit n=1 Tax=Clostridium novyi TaxID=1542 RepID=UPI0004D3F0A3|nr:distal tail protein Dit [Clostridium novyi]KEH88955.1 phage tail component [Clostridium novyi A str. 4540]
MFSIDFNNLNSYSLGLVVEHRPFVPIAERNIHFINIEGRNGTLIEDLETYGDINIPINFGFIERNDFNSKCRLIKNWLTNIQDNKLILSDDNNMFYKVKNVKTDDIARNLKTIGRLTVDFLCEPFSYYCDGLDTIEIKKPTIIYGPEFTYKSEPVIKIYGKGVITLNINNNSIKLKDVQEYITLNSTIQECYKDTRNCNNKMQGEFPLLVEENKISWTGNVQKIEIIPNWRCL